MLYNRLLDVLGVVGVLCRGLGLADRGKCGRIGGNPAVGGNGSCLVGDGGTYGVLVYVDDLGGVCADGWEQAPVFFAEETETEFCGVIDLDVNVGSGGAGPGDGVLSDGVRRGKAGDVFGRGGCRRWESELDKAGVGGFEQANVQLNVGVVTADPLGLEGCELVPHLLIDGRQGVPLSGQGVEQSTGLLLLGGAREPRAFPAFDDGTLDGSLEDAASHSAGNVFDESRVRDPGHNEGTPCGGLGLVKGALSYVDGREMSSFILLVRDRA